MSAAARRQERRHVDTPEALGAFYDDLVVWVIPGDPVPTAIDRAAESWGVAEITFNANLDFVRLP